LTSDLKEQLRSQAGEHGFEFFGVVDADELAKVPFPPNRCLEVPGGFLPEARSVIVLGMHIWDQMQNAVVTSVLPDGAIPFDDVPGSQYYNMYYEITEARGHRFAESVREAGYKTAVTHFVHAKAAATLAGLGWIGKQTLCITPQLGPHVRWVCVVTDAVLPYDEPFTENLCGDCELCVRSCPTGAIIAGPSQGVEPGKKVDFWKCIVPQEMLSEPNQAWQKWAGHYSPRGSHECLICLDACPIGREEHERRVALYSSKPAAPAG
jgi:epoxyqueuosine reductase